MTSEIRANTIKNRVGLGTIEYSNTGPVISGVTTAFNFKTGTSNLHSTGLNIFDLDVDGHTNLDNVSIAGVTTATGNLNISSGDLKIGGNTVINSGRAVYNLESVKLADTKELILGTGNDLKIYHSGSHSFIDEVGNGALKIKGDDIRFENASGTEAARIDSSGSVGINESTPDSKVDILYSSSTDTSASMISGIP